MQWLRIGFVVVAGLQITGLFLDQRLMPYAGTLALAALLAIAMASPVERRGPRRFGLAGLALLTLTALAVDARSAGYGWPGELAGDSRASGLVESGLLVAAAECIFIAVLARSRNLHTWQHGPTALLALLFFAFEVAVLLGKLSASGWMTPEPTESMWTMSVLALGALLAGLAVNTALATRGAYRRAGAGLMLQLVTTLGGLYAAVASDPLGAPWAVPGYSLNYSANVSLHRPVLIATRPVDLQRELLLSPVGQAGRPAVSAPPPRNDGGTNWSRARPALFAGALLLGMIALVTALFRTEDPELPFNPGRSAGSS